MNLPQFIYQTILPSNTGSFDVELNSCLREIVEKAISTETVPIKLTLFVNSTSADDFLIQQQHVAKVITAYFKDSCPTYNILSQTPSAPLNVCIESILAQKSKLINYKLFNGRPYVEIRSDNSQLIVASGLTIIDRLLPLTEGAHASFDMMHKLLLAENLSFDNIIRQWNYVPEICSTAKINGLNTQNYQIFNEIRHQYYSQFMCKKGYPAATGIGQLYGNFSLDFFAFVGDENITINKIESPVQLNPYQYGQQVLIGEPIDIKGIKHAPEFERAKLLSYNNELRMFVSGTASIEGEKTIGVGDVVTQTLTTIKNIEALSSIENLKRQGILPEIKGFKYSIFRAYVREKSDIEIVEKILNQYKDRQYIIVQAEICRPNLLVEIEAELQSIN